MRTFLTAVTLSVFAASCVSHTAPPASKEEQVQAARRLFECLIQNEASFDDGVSDATTIARTLINGPCYGAAMNASDVYSRDMTPQQRRSYMEAPRPPYYELASTVVLKKRAEKNGRY